MEIVKKVILSLFHPNIAEAAQLWQYFCPFTIVAFASSKSLPHF